MKRLFSILCSAMILSAMASPLDLASAADAAAIKNAMIARKATIESLKKSGKIGEDNSGLSRRSPEASRAGTPPRSARRTPTAVRSTRRSRSRAPRRARRQRRAIQLACRRNPVIRQAPTALEEKQAAALRLAF